MLRGVALLWAGSLTTAACTLATQIFLARQVTPMEFGAFSTAITIASILAVCTNMGISQFWMSFYAKAGNQSNSWNKAIIRLTGTNFALLFIATLLISKFTTQNTSLTTLLLILSPHILGQAAVEIVSARYQSTYEYKKVFLTMATPHVARLIAITALYFISSGVADINDYALTYAVTAISAYSILVIKLSKAHTKTKKSKTRSIAQLLRRSWPFGVVILLNQIYFQGNIIIAGTTVSLENAGNYAIATSIMSAIYMFPSIFYQKFMLPKLYHLRLKSPEKLESIYKQHITVMLTLGSACTVITFILASWAVGIIFGEKYSHAAAILSTLSLAAPFQFMSSAASSNLISHKESKIKIKILATITAANFSVSYAAGTFYGIDAIAWVAVCSAIILQIAYSKAIRAVKNEKA